MQSQNTQNNAILCIMKGNLIFSHKGRLSYGISYHRPLSVFNTYGDSELSACVHERKN